MEETHYYEVNLVWDTAMQDKAISSVAARKFEAASAHELLKDKKEKWTPEHMFVASVNSCLMSAFLFVAGNSKFQFISFESKVVGKIEWKEGKYSVTELVLKPVLTIPLSQNEIKAKQVLKMSERACSLTNNIKTKITFEPIISIKS